MPARRDGHDGLRELGPVRAQERDPVAGLHAARPQRAHEPVGVGVDLGERPVAGLGGDRDAVGLPLRPERLEQPPIGRRVQRVLINSSHAGAVSSRRRGPVDRVAFDCVTRDRSRVADHERNLLRRVTADGVMTLAGQDAHRRVRKEGPEHLGMRHGNVAVVVAVRDVNRLHDVARSKPQGPANAQ